MTTPPDWLTDYCRTAVAELAPPRWSFAWDRAPRRAGACWHNRRRITMSGPLFSIPENVERHAEDTLLHEVAHAIAGPSAGHGPAWKRTARLLGANPTRCYDATTMIPVPAPIIGHCSPTCATPHVRHRMPPEHVRHHYYCNTCRANVTWKRTGR